MVGEDEYKTTEKSKKERNFYTILVGGHKGIIYEGECLHYSQIAEMLFGYDETGRCHNAFQRSQVETCARNKASVLSASIKHRFNTQ